MRRISSVLSSVSFVALASLALGSLVGCAPEAAVPPATPAPAPAPPPPAPAPPVVATTPDEAFRASKPEPLANDPAFTPPVPVQKALKNGAQVLVVENHAVPLVAVEIVLHGGVDREPLDRRALSSFVADMLMEGTKTRSSLDLAVAEERLAAQLGTDSDAESVSVHLNALKETLPDALALMADVLLNPAFKSEDIERERGLMLTGLSGKKGNARALAHDDFDKLLWGDKNPWGLPSGGTPATVKAIAAKDLAHFHQTYFVPNNATISVSGDVTPDEAVAALEKVLGGWKKGAVPPARAVKYPAASARSIVFTDVPTATQSQVSIGWRGPKATAPELIPLQIANTALGALFTSRLNLNLREDKAFTYRAISGFELFRDTSAFQASAAIIAKHTAEAVTEFEKELQRMKTDPISDEELARAKEAMIRRLPSQLETNDAVADAIAGLVELGRPLDYFKTYPERVRGTPKADVIAAANKFIDPEHWPIVVVGPKSEALAPLKALGIGDVKEVTP